MLEKYTKDSFLKLRREKIAREFSFLNDMQKKAVFKTEGPLLLLAGAGSGKTTVIINRIANIIKYGDAYNSTEVPTHITDMDYEILEEYLKTGDPALSESVDSICAQNPASPWSVIAITFTNKAANELRERLARAIGESANDVWASTFHSACVRILRRNIEKLGYSPSFTIYDTADSERVIKDVSAELGINDKELPARAIRNIISRAKDSMISPSAFKKECEGNARDELIAKVYEKYQTRLKSANAVDFDDIIMLTVELLTKHEDVRTYYQKKFKYVLIDEYQDTNHAQYLLASLLAGGYRNICVVGDDDQSIYRFRGATIENILDFEKHFENAETIRLEQNYRSTSSILDVANTVIKNNTGRKGKNLWTDKTDGDLPLVFCATNERTEAEYIADAIISARANGAAFSDCAVLYRINAQSMQIEKTFKRNAIPYRLIGGVRFFDRAEVKDILAYLCVISNPQDTLRLKRIINVPARRISPKTVELVEEVARRHNLSPFEVISRSSEFPELSKNVSALSSFAAMIQRLREKAESCSLGELYDALIEESGYVRELLSKGDVESRVRTENILELKSSMVEYDTREDASLSGYLEEISLYTDLDKYNPDEDCVTMMTIHSAKGLEFPTVFVCGLEEEIFPSKLSMGIDAEIEEERRLFYVAATRARTKLYLTYATSRTMFGQTRYSRMSRFLSEIPDGKVEKKQLERIFDGTDAFSDLGGFGYEPERRRETKPRRTASATTSFGYSSVSKASAAPAAPALSVGDRVVHKVFRGGLVVSATPVGGDVLLEIAFDSAGTKRLLYKAAAKYLEKE